MAVTLVGKGVDASGSTSAVAAYPLGNAGDLLLVFVGSGEATDTVPDTPTGMTLGASVLGGTGAYGNNAGQRRLTVFRQELSSTSSGTVTVSLTGGDTIVAQAFRFAKGATDTWQDTYVTSTNDTTADASFSISSSSTVSYGVNDWAIVATAHPYDVPTSPGGTITIPGCTVANTNEQSEITSTLGNDVKVIITTADITAGTASGVSTFADTFSAATTGAGVFVRLRAGANPNVTVNAVNAPATSLAKVPSAIGGHVGPRRVLLVVGDPNNLAADSSGQAYYDHLIGQGHIVTLWDDGVGAPANLNTAYDVCVLQNSVSSGMSMSGYDTATIPVLATGVRSPHTNYSNAPAVNGSSQTTIYVKTQGIGDPITPPDITVAGLLTVLDVAFTQRYNLNSDLGSGVHQIASTDGTNLTHIAYSHYNTGDAMFAGTAPSPRAWIFLHAGSIGSNLRGWEFLDRMMLWAVPDTTIRPTAATAIASSVTNGAVTPPVATASATSSPPIIGSSGGNAIAPSASSASALAVAPSISGGFGASVTAPAAIANSGTTVDNLTINGETLVSGAGAVTATAVAIPPLLSSTGALTAPSALSSAASPAPLVSSGAGTNGVVSAIKATATSAGLAPDLFSEVLLDALAGLAQASTPTPIIFSDSIFLVAESAQGVLALALSPIVEAIQPTYFFIPPTFKSRFSDNADSRLFSRMSYDVGISVVKKDGAYIQYRYVDPADIDAADVIYLGGHTYEISQDEYDDLVEAGYGTNLLVST